MPIPPKYDQEPSAGTGQNTSGNVRTDVPFNCTRCLRSDHALLDGSHPYYDAFNLWYEV